MNYKIRPRTDGNLGRFYVAAREAQEALSIMKGMIERGVQHIEILDFDGHLYDPAELERITSESKNA